MGSEACPSRSHPVSSLLQPWMPPIRLDQVRRLLCQAQTEDRQLPETWFGKTLASATRKLRTPLTRSFHARRSLVAWNEPSQLPISPWPDLGLARHGHCMTQSISMVGEKGTQLIEEPDVIE